MAVVKTDPETGAVVDLTYPSYAPPESFKTFIRVRDRTCRYPGCTRRARRCDVDHRVPWPLGGTCDTNCACLCRRHHRAKHEGGWRVRAIKPGVFEWTSPLGFVHIVEPDPVTEPQPHHENPTRIRVPTSIWIRPRSDHHFILWNEMIF